MKIAFFLLSFLIFDVAFAQNCADMQDGEMIRVDEAGKSLGGYKVQDQDGLGSCYANAASLLLQSTLPENPEVSYLHLATLYKTEKLKELRSDAKSNGNFNIYAKEEKNSEKAINGGGSAKNWDLALDGGNTCSVISTIKNMQEAENRPVVCTRTNLNLEKILSSGDQEHKQFKTILESSLYMNQFQKTFGDIHEKPGFFNKKKIQAAQEKYQDFKKAFELIVASKKRKIEEHDCNRINADYLDSLVDPVAQMALSYKSCFENESDSKENYWCKVTNGVVYNKKVNDDGSIEMKGVDPGWMKKLQTKITQRKTSFTADTLMDDMAESFVENAAMTSNEKILAKKFLKDSLLKKSDILNSALNDLSAEYNEVASTGFSPACVKRNTYNYFQTKDYEDDWKKNQILCSYDELMKQATNVIVKYKESGLDDLEAAMSFLTTNAGSSYDQALMAMYASDCDDKSKVSVPKNISCNTVTANWQAKKDIDSTIVKKLKANQPLTASLCASILKKPKSAFVGNECGHHALGITGIQCVSGKYKYLIQNSWGANNKASPESGIENIDGKGAYWFSEQSFYDSVYGVDYLQ